MAAEQGGPTMLLSFLREYHRRMSLHRKIFFASLTMLFLILLLNTIAYWRIFIPMFVGQMRTYSARVAYYLATRVRPLILSGDLEEMRKIIIHRESVEYEIAYIFVTDPEGRVLSHTFQGGFPPELEWTKPLGKDQEMTRLVQVGDSWIYDTAVTVEENGVPIGVVHVGMRKTPLDKMIQEMGLVLGLLLVVIIALAIFLSQLAATYITTPLTRLTEAMKRLARNPDDSLPPMLRLPRCWELKNCNLQDCPAYGNTSAPCWTLLAQAFQVTGSGFPSRGVCRACKVYREAQGDEIAQLAHAFGDIILAIRTKAEEVSKSERKRKLLFDNDPNGVFLFVPSEGRILEANATAMGMLGCCKEELLERDFMSVLEPEDRRIFWEKASSSGPGEAFDIPKLRVKRCSGDSLVVDLHARVLDPRELAMESEGQCLLIRMVDVTKRLEEESLLLQASKMATLGEMATGVAHELNQPLNVLKVGADFFRKMAERNEAIPKDKFLTIARNMSEQVDRASRIIDHLREFGRKSEFQLYPTDVNEAIRGAFTLLGQQLALRQIKVELDLDPQLPEILADKNRLEQIFLNLITNARDAMTARDDGAPRRLRVTSRLRGDKVLVEFSDTGVGMTEEVKRRIFEPFFTTKPPGEGTGLGLSISYNLVKDFKGTIEVESEPGKGATFRLTFPARRESESHGEEAASHR